MIPRIPVPEAALAETCRRWNVRRLALFGSVLRDDFSKRSDVDVWVEFAPGPTPGFFGIESLRAELSALLGGRVVDIVTPGGLHPLLRDRILAQAVEQYAA
jgi:predicted nucleotidyltransferase